MTRLLASITLAFVCAFSLPACESGAASDEASGITRACYRSFAPTLVAWEDALVRVPERCAYLDKLYTVQLANTGEIPCTTEASNQTVAGCTTPEDHTIYLLASGDNVQMTDTSVHEWVHALADCVDGDRDADHLRAELWADYGPNSVEAQAQASAEIGECL
jgi:hypothetical protein